MAGGVPRDPARPDGPRVLAAPRQAEPGGPRGRHGVGDRLGAAVLRPAAELEAEDVAGKHPEVSEQVMAEVDRLGALQVGVAGHRPVFVGLR